MTSLRAAVDSEFSEAVRSFLSAHSEILCVGGRFTIKKSPCNVRLPSKLTRNLCWLIGILQGDGNINGTRILISEQEERFHVEIGRAFRALFGISFHKYHDIARNTYYYVKSKIVSTFLKEVFGLPDGRKMRLGVPVFIQRSELVLRAAYLGGVFDAEGFVSKRQAAIALSISSKAIAKFVHRTLSELGVHNTMRGRSRSRRRSEYLVEIYGKKRVNLFHKRIGFRHPVKVIQSRYDR